MKRFFTLICILGILCVSCTKEYEYSPIQEQRDYLPEPTRTTVTDAEEGLMVLGEPLTNPYALTAMQQARTALLASNSDLVIPELTTSHYYVRFEPQNDDELYTLLQDTTISFYEYPLDREVISGTYYHDPTIVDSLPTYQYASIPKAHWDKAYANSSISYTILCNLFIPEESEDFFEDNNNSNPGWGGGVIEPLLPPVIDTTIIDGPIPMPEPDPSPIDPGSIANTNTLEDEVTTAEIINLLVNKSMILCGHENAIQQFANTDYIPNGRITAYDDIVNGPVPIVGAKVRARRWFTTHTGFTDADGYFTCDGSFKRPANYSIIWERAYWDIREGNIGQAYYNGPKQRGAWNLYIGDGNSKSLRYATIHRAAYRIYYGNIGDLYKPGLNKKIKIAYHHNAGSVAGAYYDHWWFSFGLAPQIRIYGKHPNGSYYLPSMVLSTLYHELAGHATHSYHSDLYSTLTTRYKEAWAICAEVYLTNLEYSELNCIPYHLNIYTNESYLLIPDCDFNRQLWSKHYHEDTRYEYPPIFIDVIDNYNQKVLEEDGEYNEGHFPNDNLYLRNMAMLRNAVLTSGNFDEVKSYLSSHQNSISATSSFDIEDLNTLFEYYDNY